MLFAGLDVSTQSCKLLIIDQEENQIVVLESISYDKDLPEYNTLNGDIKDKGRGVSESDPLMWIKAIDTIFAKLQKQKFPLDEIKCISVSGQQHGLVALDANGKLSRSTSKLWNDFSTREECELLTEKLGGNDQMVEEVGNAQLTGYTAAKIYHMLRHEPEAYKKTKTFFLVHNYINYYLTGGVITMEPGDASGMALWHPGKEQWSDNVINAIDTGLKEKLPMVTSSTKTIGKISDELVSRFGFNPNCRIDAGSGDNMYGAIGTGNTSEGIVTVSLGTSGTAYTFLKEPFIDPTGEIAAFCDSTGHYLTLLCVTNLANGYNAILKEQNITHQDFNQLIPKTEPGNKGRILIPWYEGERTPNVAQATPVYVGFGLGDFTPEILCRAVLEGHIQNLYSGFKRLPVTPKEIRLTGGLSQSPAWCQAIADIFNTETVPVKGEGAALGAALHAAWVWNNENSSKKSIQEISEPYIKFNEKLRKKPNPNVRKIYDIQSEAFQTLSALLRFNNNAFFKIHYDLKNS
ncbi:MAG: xylulokinase [Calditrichaeota bacterium]|nr:xylulokinase [Calditrichota bacterium]